MATQKTLNALRKLSTCEISDALIKLGLTTGGFIPDLHIFSPRQTESLKVVGPAFTVQMVAENVKRDEEPPKTKEHFVDACPNGSVMVISAPFIRNAGCWGGLMSTAAKVKGVQGVLIRGGCRDLAEHRDINFPVFANYHTTLGQKSFVRPSALSVPVDMSPLSYSSPEITQLYDPAFDYKISVNPGDIIVGDEDGCVAIPPELVEQVLKKAVTGREVDDNVKKDLEAGKGVKESMAKWRGGGGTGASGKP
ncbi:hypothetical protein L202_02439 [Cryptococcus amylolentus CBS 6039]|uniref:4-hydroxy-4-methyl-2-oxoglutarate aldolase n=1 Tax=Cryptococcus amylolentus CBS 6039 TaxID=1295533 RepID=A0A1E3I0N0_9TREE|nr:hypothetical protein L202_02439 [Cryptococcus amylolentus CBS 6039]ODN82139.1 hypothetical protein L202_02439 [Cryptococcus amylolentus CBS 6039]